MLMPRKASPLGLALAAASQLGNNCRVEACFLKNGLFITESLPILSSEMTLTSIFCKLKLLNQTGEHIKVSSETESTETSARSTDDGRSNFIRDIMIEDVASGKHGGSIQTRFPPEPNGYLHIGHAKAICLDFGLAAEFGGKCNLRFDDTNPSKEETEYVEAIMEDVRWLGFQWDGLFYASDYFQQLYDWAIQLIKEGKAFVCDLGANEIREYRGTLTEPGKNSPYRHR